MVGLKCVFLVSLVAGAFVVGNAESETLENLLRRMLDQMHAQNVQAAQDYVQRLMSAPGASPAIQRVSVLDMTNGKLLATGGQGEVALATAADKARLAGAVKNGRYQMYDNLGLRVGGQSYRLYMTNLGRPVVRFGGRTGTILVKKTRVGAVVAQVPAKMLTDAVLKALMDTSK